MPLFATLRWWSFGLLLMSLGACAQKAPELRVLRPAEIDTTDIRRVAIGVFEVGTLNERYVSERDGVWEERSAQLSPAEQQSIARAVRARVVNQLTTVPYFEVAFTDEFATLENDAVLQQLIVSEGYATQDVDAVLSGKIWIDADRTDGVELGKASLEYYQPPARGQKGPGEKLTVQQLAWWPYKMLSGTLVLELKLTRLSPTGVVATDLITRRYAHKIGGSPAGALEQVQAGIRSLQGLLASQQEDDSSQEVENTDEVLPPFTAMIAEMASSTSADFVKRVSITEMNVSHPIAAGGDERARLLIQNGAYETALERLQQRTANNPNPADLYNLGLCFEALGDYGLALTNYREAHQRDQTNLTYAQGIGRIETLQRQSPQLRTQLQSRNS
jgi:hypothetical protein